MALPKIKLFKKGSKHEGGGFLVADLTDCSLKALYLSENTEDPKKYVVSGVSVFSSPDGLTKEGISSAIEECLVQSNKSTKDVIVGLSGSGIIGFILIVKSEREDSEKEITSDELEDLYQKVKETAYIHAKNKCAYLFADDVEFEALDLVVTSTFIENNIVEDPIGLSGADIQVSVFCSYAEKSFYDRVVDIFSSLKYSVLTVTTALYSQVKLLSQKDSNFVLIDVGLSHTDVAVVLGKNIIQTKSFEIGGDYFTKSISESLGLSMKEADGKKAAFSGRTLPEDDADKISDLLYECGKDWRTAVVESLSSMPGIKSFPSKIILSGGGAGLPIIHELLYEDAWCKPIPFENRLDIKVISGDDWDYLVKDELNLLSGPRMGVPVSLAIVKREI
ncbi:hypothetical protein A2982_03720 [candidate division WWE3 bacterium RIFCSPLOWO2_01_FULL_39_13]|uniref:SHS2 domain-containing protein n=1 Tax=candidate division WWE3 bacterium RIFCSPLOWO2_01_FULL_39_13 TaxID=1802624 RepID=A0A1F4V591_UNCKA|nr:MAG: hypothetical protein A2982_03720 [candidate division WWE3 bacterium RIFCSPLOWO2_01_FULL_39_13]